MSYLGGGMSDEFGAASTGVGAVFAAGLVRIFAMATSEQAITHDPKDLYRVLDLNDLFSLSTTRVEYHTSHITAICHRLGLFMGAAAGLGVGAHWGLQSGFPPIALVAAPACALIGAFAGELLALLIMPVAHGTIGLASDTVGLALKRGPFPASP
jgi:hypothetical protein